MPEVSVIIPAYYSHRTIALCLQSLERQTFRDFEIIVVDSTPGEQTAAEVRTRFPFVRLHHQPERLLPHAARNKGVELAGGRILVFTDPDCCARPDWLESLVAAHRQGHRAVGGALDCNGDWWTGAVHMAKFSWWLAGGKPEPRPDIATANSSYLRAVWDSAGPFLTARFAGDSALNWRVRAAGHELWFEPRAIVTHIHESGVSQFLEERWRRGRDFGATRVEGQRWSRARCLLYLLLSPALPLVMTWRGARFALRSRQIARWMLTAPVALGSNLAWCLGEARSHWEALWRR